jgi:glycosyltransferase involved in cell wall biosynthesis
MIRQSTQGPAGVTIAICCYNSADKLPMTLQHLREQQAPTELPWEVLVIDNGSTDDTAGVARTHWAPDHSVPLRIAREPKPGLSNARKCAFREAHYELISFIDDDNWVAPNWVETVALVMNEHPDAAICFGKKESVCESPPPWWFKEFEWQFVIGPPIDEACDFTDRPGEIPGAGFNVRKSAWDSLLDGEFEFLGTDRLGKKLLAGGDTELVCAVKLAGWGLWYDPRLTLHHFLPRDRVRWEYLRRSNYGFGFSSVNLDPYYACANEDAESASQLSQNPIHAKWLRYALHDLKKLLREHLRSAFLAPFAKLEGDLEVLTVQQLAGRMMALIRIRGQYDLNFEHIRKAKWRKPPRSRSSIPADS